MAKVLYGALKVDGKLYEPGTKVSGLPKKVQAVVRKQEVATVDESAHPRTAKETVPEEWEAPVEDETQEEDEE